MMWKAVVMSVFLFVAGVSTMDGPTYGVKLCGREFIRAVIFTCGGSRWRRSTDVLSLDPFDSNPADTADGWTLASGTKFSLQHDTEPVSLEMEQTGQQASGFIRPARFFSDEVLKALRSSGRKGRDVVLGLSNACCKWGCSKNEISSLC